MLLWLLMGQMERLIRGVLFCAGLVVVRWRKGERGDGRGIEPKM